MVVVDDSSLQGRLTAQVGWLGLRVGGRLAWTEWTLAMTLWSWWQHC